MSDSTGTNVVRLPRALKYDREAILTLWARGKSAGAIAVALNMPAEVIAPIVWKARKAGDRRAVKRGTSPFKRRIIGWVQE